MKTYNKFLLSLVMLAIVSACDDFLDKNPLDRPSNKTFYSTTDEILMGINACYNAITSLNLVNDADNVPQTVWPHFVNAFYRDNVTDIAATRLTTTVFESFKKGELNSGSSLSSTEWRFYYVGIGRTNALLTGMVKAESVTDPVLYKRVRSEARVIRAICYMNLIQNFGDVPLIKEFIDVDDALNIERTPKAEILQFIYTDLDEAAPDLPTKYTGSDRGRITMGAAYAMKARVALYNGDYITAKAAAKAVMDLNVYKLYPSYRDLFTYKGEFSDEIILDYQYKSPERTHELHTYNAPRNQRGQSQSFPTEDLVASFECTDGLPVDESPLYSPDNPYANRDPRLKGAIILPRVWDGTTIKTNGTVFNGIEFMSSKENLFAADGTTKLASSLSEKEKTVWDTKTNTMVANQEVTNGFSSFTGYCVRKYLDSTNFATPQACHNNFILCRYPEVLLIYAEASVESGQIDNAVLDALNTIRARAYGNTTAAGTNIDATNYPKITSMNPAELRKIIRRERKVELCFEGFRLDDLKRWELLTKALNQRKNYGRPENFTMLDADDIPQIDDDGLVALPYAEDRYGLNNEVRKLRYWETFGTITDAFNMYPVPLGEIQLNPNLLPNNPGYTN